MSSAKTDYLEKISDAGSECSFFTFSLNGAKNVFFDNVGLTQLDTKRKTTDLKSFKTFLGVQRYKQNLKKDIRLHTDSSWFNFNLCSLCSLLSVTYGNTLDTKNDKGT